LNLNEIWTYSASSIVTGGQHINITKVTAQDESGEMVMDTDPANHFGSAPALPGDYNKNGQVDAADYVLWRNALGQTGLAPFSSADGNGDGTVDDTDYGVWRANFGATLPLPAAASGSAAFVGADPVLTIGDTLLSTEAKRSEEALRTKSHDLRGVAFATFKTNPTPSKSISRPIAGSKIIEAAVSDDDLLALLALDRVGQADTLQF
jgi:hypothetical protein